MAHIFFYYFKKHTNILESYIYRNVHSRVCSRAAEMSTMVKLTATFGNQKFTRTTDRTYTHVLIARNTGEEWKAVSWAGSLFLAQKRVSEFARVGREVRIIEVDQ